MPYTAEISRSNPSCFLFLIDHSGSMAGPMPGNTSQTKAHAVADTINKILCDLTIKCAKAEGVRDYFHVGVIGYGEQVRSAFVGALSGRELVAISELAIHPARVESRTKKVPDGAGGLVDTTVKFPIWFDAYANGGTPMCQAMGEARRLLSGWLAQHPNCFPPVVIHITDGESVDGDPTQSMEAVRGLASSDGNVLLFNIHISSADSQKVVFPESAAGLPDAYSLALFNTASPLTLFMRDTARTQGLSLGEGARAFVLNADLETLIKSLDIGTKPSNMK